VEYYERNLTTSKERVYLISLSTDIIEEMVSNNESPSKEKDSTFNNSYKESELFSKTNNIFLISLRGKTYKNSIEMLFNVISLRI